MTNALQNSITDYRLGLDLKNSGRFDEALAVFQMLCQLSPSHPGAAFQAGCILMVRRQYTDALSCFLQMESYYPDHVEMQFNIGTCYLQLNKLFEAKSYYIKACERMPEDAQLLFNLGVISMQQGQIREAIDYYARVVSVDPVNFAAHHNLAVALLSLQDARAALLHFRAALAVQPENLAVRHMIDSLEGKNKASSPKEYISYLFDSYADHYDQHLIKTLEYVVPQAMYDLISANVNILNGGWRVLDLGCGTGLCGEVFRQSASWLTGVDLSGGMLAEAGKKAIFDELIRADAIDFLKGCQEVFDLVLAGDVLVYYGNVEAIMLAVSRALCDRGWFVFSVESSESQAYHLTESGRFAHNKQYIEDVAGRNGFQLVACHRGTLRMQRQLAVTGYLYLMQKQSAPLSSTP